jgi:hypothetical protein
MMTGWGLSNAQLEPGGYTGRGWTINRYSVEMIEPQYLNVIAYPMAWSPSINGTIGGKPVILEGTTPDELAKYRGKLRGAIVLVGSRLPGRPHISHLTPRDSPMTN